MTDEPLLRIENLSVDYVVGAGTFHALNDVSFELFEGQVVGIVGETGCGKTTLGHSIPRLLPEPPAKILSGRIEFQGTDLLKVPKWKMPMIRGTGIGMIFQEPINSLHPTYRVYDQIVEAIRIRRLRDSGKGAVARAELKGYDYSRRPSPKTASILSHTLVPTAPDGTVTLPRPKVTSALKEEVLEFLRLVRINDPERILGLYPHELSGGMRQRVMIAMALSEKPSLLIADEPTSALDVTIQAQVLTLMKELMAEVHTSVLFISHDLGVIAEIADLVGVMYAGHLVEFGPVQEIFESSRHPYTKALVKAIPAKYKSEGLLPALPGSVPNLAHLPPGCPFMPRCPLARPVCNEPPGPTLASLPSESGSELHRVACYFSGEVEGLP